MAWLVAAGALVLAFGVVVALVVIASGRLGSAMGVDLGPPPPPPAEPPPSDDVEFERIVTELLRSDPRFAQTVQRTDRRSR